MMASGNVFFYGACKLCDCNYMGSADNSCQCSHPSSQHIPLGACRKDNCECEAFCSTLGFSPCFNCQHDSDQHGGEKGDLVYNQLKQWVAQGITQMAILKLYKTKFGESLSRRGLQRKLAAYGIRLIAADISDEQILEAVRLENANGVIGYHRMHRILRTKHDLLVGRDRLHHLMRSDESIPKGAGPKSRTKGLHPKKCIPEGPNTAWALGVYDRLSQSFGFYICAAVDNFSRKVLSLKVLPNKEEKTVGSWMKDVVFSVQGMPKTIIIDNGAEWNAVVPFLEVTPMESLPNKKIKTLWSQLSGHSDIKRYESMFRQLQQSGRFNSGNEKHRWALWMSFQKALQKSLNQFRENYNMQVIRNQKDVTMPSGYSPNIVYEHPETFCRKNQLQKVTISKRSDSDDGFERFMLPEDLLKQSVSASKDECLPLYLKICDVITKPGGIF